jgi:hypothetical protein
MPANMTTPLNKKQAEELFKRSASPESYMSSKDFIKKQVKTGVNNFKTGVQVVKDKVKKIVK